jgi:hypothetical protein
MSPLNKKTASCVIIGSTYAALGLLEVLSPWVADDLLGYLTAGNIMMGLVLLLTGLVFLAGARESLNGGDGEAYIIVGCMLGLFIGTVALLTMGANGAEHLLGNEDLADWTALDDLTPAIAMIIPSALLLHHGLRTFREVPASGAAR